MTTELLETCRGFK